MARGQLYSRNAGFLYLNNTRGLYAFNRLDLENNVLERTMMTANFASMRKAQNLLESVNGYTRKDKETQLFHATKNVGNSGLLGKKFVLLLVNQTLLLYSNAAYLIQNSSNNRNNTDKHNKMRPLNTPDMYGVLSGRILFCLSVLFLLYGC